jgi:hypothetical protein
MKFIARHLNLIGLLMLTAFGAAAAGLYFQTPKYAPAEKADSVASAPATTSPSPHKDGCCGEKPVAPEPPPAAVCPHLAAQAAPEPSCCPKPANP